MNRIKLLLPLLLALAMLLCACSVNSVDEPTEKTKKTTEATTTEPATSEPETSSETEITSDTTTETTTAATTEITSDTTTGTTPPTPESTFDTQPEPETLILGHLSDREAEHTDEYGNVYHYSYHVPCASQGANAGWFNEEMEKLMREEVDPAYNDIGADVGPHWMSVDYTVGTHGDITSVLITLVDLWDCSSYLCYNLDRDGSPVDNDAMMAAAGIEPQICLDEMYEAFDKYTAIDETKVPEWAIPELETARARTLDPSNYSLDNLMFFDAMGSLGFIGNVYSIAGADSYLHPFVWTDGGFLIADEGPNGAPDDDDTLFRDLSWLYGEWEADGLPDADKAIRNVGLVFFEDGTAGFNLIDPAFFDPELAPDGPAPETLEFYNGEWHILLDEDTAYPHGAIVLELERAGGIYAMDGIVKSMRGVYCIVPDGDLLSVTHVDGEPLLSGWEGSEITMYNLVRYAEW